MARIDRQGALRDHYPPALERSLRKQLDHIDALGIHEHGETIARGVFGEILVGDSRVLLEPLLGRELFEGCGELVVDFLPGAFEIGAGDGIGMRAVGIGDVNLIKLGMQALAEAKERKETVVDSGEMAEQVEEAILSGSDGLLEFLVVERGDDTIKSSDGELP